MNPLTLGLASIKKRDSSRFRRRLFAEILNENLAARVAHRMFLDSRLRPAISLALLIYSWRRLFQIRARIERHHEEVAVFHFANERRAIERFGPERVRRRGSISYRSIHPAAFSESVRFLFFGGAFAAKKLLRSARVSMRLIEKNGFLIGARQAEFLALYGFYRNLFRRRGVRGRTFISSSEANPEIISAVLAAKSNGNKIIFINHSALEREQGIFFHDEVLISGSDRIAAKRPPAPPDFTKVKRIGIACSIIADRERLRKVVTECLRTFPGAEIVIRQHPNRTFRAVSKNALPKNSRVVVSSRSRQPGLEAQSAEWNFAIAGSSSVHLDLRVLGIPTVHMNIDGIDWDPYDFAGSGLVPSAENAGDIPDRLAVYGLPKSTVPGYYFHEYDTSHLNPPTQRDGQEVVGQRALSADRTGLSGERSSAKRI